MRKTRTTEPNLDDVRAEVDHLEHLSALWDLLGQELAETPVSTPLGHDLRGALMGAAEANARAVDSLSRRLDALIVDR